MAKAMREMANAPKRKDTSAHLHLLVDGLYQVTTSYLCAGFVIEGGRVTQCAPILKRKLRYWLTVAERIGD